MKGYYDMKGSEKMKIIAITMAVALLLGCVIEPGSACEQLPVSAEYLEYRDTTYWAVTEESRELAGMLSPEEAVGPLRVQDVKCDHVRGFLPGGALIREAARLRVICAADLQLGIKALSNTVTRIRPQYRALVEAALARELGADVELCGGSVSTCILYVMEDGTVSERLFTRYHDCFGVGWMYFNADISDSDLVEIVIGDWDGDGELELGLRAGSAPEPEKKPEPKPEEKPEASGNCSNNSNSSEQADTTDSEEGVSSKTCWKFEFDLHFLLQRCQRIFSGK